MEDTTKRWGKNAMRSRNGRYQSESGNKEGREKAFSTERRKTVIS
jgi:hypothetical protein